MQGDFLDLVVESTLRSLVSQLKVEYRKELGKALEAASLGPPGSRPEASRLEAVGWPPAFSRAEAASRADVDRTDASLVAAPSLNTPETELVNNQMGGPGELKAARGFGLPVMEQADNSSIECIAHEHLEIERPTEMVSSTAWRESKYSGSNGMAQRSAMAPHSAMGIWEETMDKPADKDKTKMALTEKDTEEIVRLRVENIKREEAAEKLARGYAFIIEAPEDLDGASWFRRSMFKVIQSSKFDFSIGFVITLNSLAIGIETSISRHGGQIPLSLQVLEYTFLLIYCVELAARVYVGGLRTFSNNWVRFDAVMVAAGILSLLLTLSSFGGATAAGVVDNINMLKMIRLFRLAKTVRVLVQFRTLWMLVQGLMYAVMPMIWTAVLMSVVIYVFAVIAMEMILVTDADGDYDAAAHRYDTLGGSMLTLMQFMTLDSVAIIYTPLITTKPWLAIYFVIFLLLGPVALMNIVTAIMVESSLRTANEDQEAKKVWEQMRRKNMMPKLRQMFIDLDTSGDGEVDLEEVMNAPVSLKEAMQHMIGLDQLEEIFNLLDFDGSGSVDIEEFVEGILRTNGEKPSELFVILKQGKAILNRLRGVGTLRPTSLRSSAQGGADDGARGVSHIA